MNYSDEEKTKRLLDAQEHPEHYTDEELREIIHDARPLAQLKRALVGERADAQDINVDGAWKMFCQSHPDDSHPLSRRHLPHGLRVAAVFLGCIFLASVAFAAMTQLGWIRSPFATEKPGVAQHVPVAKAVRGTTTTADSIALRKKKPAPVVKVFDNATLSDILSAMGQYYGLKVIFHSETAKTIRLHFEWNQTKSIDANIAILNGFQQIAITRSGDTLNVE